MTAELTAVVTGFGRCGTTLLMRMLDAGGMRCFADSRASFELGRLAVPSASVDWGAYAGGAVKVLDPQRWFFDRGHRLRFLFLSRDSTEQARSQAKLLAMMGVRRDAAQVRAIRASIERDLRHVGTVFGGQPVKFLRFEHLLAEPLREAGKIARFLERDDLDVEAMAAVVVRRSPRCLPDLRYELELVAAEDAERRVQR